ncbi:MAG: PD40 domain-containing protein [Acidobacteria bacterium]|nr:PD40 domain-containing protein [Acidobacteriota bacterium]
MSRPVRRRTPRRSWALALLLALTIAPFSARAAHGRTTRVSLAWAGSQSSGPSAYPAVSADGRYVAFTSWASDLVPGDTNGWPDVFVRDRATGETTRVSVSSSGKQGNGPSGYPSISADGRYVVFESAGTKLDEPPLRGVGGIYVHDRSTGTTSLVSVTVGNERSQGEFAVISGNGRYVAFWSGDPRLVSDKIDSTYDVFVRDLDTQTTGRIVCGWDSEFWLQGLSISFDGQYVAFPCRSSPGPVVFSQVYVVDRQSSDRGIASVSSGGDSGNASSAFPSISADGRYVAFDSGARNLVPNDSAPGTEVFVRDRLLQQTRRVSLATSGEQQRWALCVFGPQPSCPGLEAHSLRPSIGGTRIAFQSYAGNLAPDDTNFAPDIFVHDLSTGETERVSVSTGRRQANNQSDWPAMSADGIVVVYGSLASNLVPDDTNGTWDVFAYDFAVGPPTCPGGVYEEGPLSGVLHEAGEPRAGPAVQTLHEASCAVAGAGG